MPTNVYPFTPLGKRLVALQTQFERDAMSSPRKKISRPRRAAKNPVKAGLESAKANVLHIGKFEITSPKNGWLSKPVKMLHSGGKSYSAT